MESELSPDKEKKTPPVPIKTYRWEDIRRAREAGGYPWTHLLKDPFEDSAAEDFVKHSITGNMSRELSRSRTRSPVDKDIQKILNLDSSPGSSRKHGEEGADEGVHIPSFSKEVSLDSEDDVINDAVKAYIVKGPPETPASSHLATSVEVPKNVSPKGILKRRAPEQQYIGVIETREKTKCCHPLVNKIKHLADKTLHKLERNENEKSPSAKRKKNENQQEIRQLKSSPGAVRRQKFGAIKLGDSDEMSKTMSVETPPPRKKKEHIYEDIEDKNQDSSKTLQFSPNIEEVAENKCNSNMDNGSLGEKKSIASQDPSLVIDDSISLKTDEHVMEKLHRKDDINKEALFLDEEMDPDEPNVDEIFQNQLDETIPKNDSSNITITEILDDDTDPNEEHDAVPIETSPSPSPRQTIRKREEIELISSEWSKLSRWTSEGGTPIEKPVRPTREGSVQVFTPDVRCACQFFQCDSLLPERVNPVGTRPTSRTSNIFSYESDHEYEIIEKPPENITYNTINVGELSTMVKADDELSSTTSLERKYLQPAQDDDEQQIGDKGKTVESKNDTILEAELLQKDIEDRYFVNTPSTISRTECEISTSQVDSSALENLPLKRENRPKNMDSLDSKIQQRIKDGTGKLKEQAGKLKCKIQNMKTAQFTLPERPKINLPSRPKFKMPDRPKISLPDRPKFSLPDRRKFSLPDRPKFKKINISEKLNLGDRKKFTLPQRPKFHVPELPKFKMPDRPKVNFPSLGRKKEYKIETTESSTDLRNVSTEEFEAKTYPRLFSRKKKSEIPKTSSSPTLNREDTPPPTFTFTRVKMVKPESASYSLDSPEEPREYGNIDPDLEVEKQFETTYDFDNVETEYGDEAEINQFDENRNAVSIPDISPSNQESTHVINEINNDEFFVRPRGISRENIQVREYLSDEIRQAFKIPKNVLALMGSDSKVDGENVYANEPDADPELMLDEIEQMQYSTEDLNDKDDGYYTFPPVRPSRAKRKKKEPKPDESIQYIDDSMNASMQFSEVDLSLPEENNIEIAHHNFETDEPDQLDFSPATDLHSIHEYANDDIVEYPDNVPIQSQTLPMPPKRQKRAGKLDVKHSSLTDIKNFHPTALWEEPGEPTDDIIVYRTEHEYIVPHTEATMVEDSPVPPRRNRSRSSRGTSLCDDDRTSHGAESLTLDSHLQPTDDIQIERGLRHESPGYATVDKGQYMPSKTIRRSKSKTPPVRRRKSNSSERKYYTVGPSKPTLPDRPPRKKSSTSLVTLDSFTKKSISADLTQYVEIDEPGEVKEEEVHKDLNSGEILNKMKDRPLPPPPRPPRGSKKEKSRKPNTQNDHDSQFNNKTAPQGNCDYTPLEARSEEIIEIEVSTQTDPLPDDVDFELGMDENLELSISSSLRDMVEEDSTICKSHSKATESPRYSRPTSRSEKSFKISDPKITELSKSNIGRTSPTVILVEKRVSSPTRINEREEMLTEASLTVQHIDIDMSQIPDIMPLPEPKETYAETKFSKSNASCVPNEDKALERVTDTTGRDVQLDNLVTQRLQVRDLDVGRLNVSELQASKILVSDIEGMTLQVTELDSKSGHISVSGIEFSQSVIDEIVKKFTEITTNQVPAIIVREGNDNQRPVSREEHTQTEEPALETKAEAAQDSQTTLPKPEVVDLPPVPPTRIDDHGFEPPPRPPRPGDDSSIPPQRPPPPDLTPLLYSYLQDIALPPASFYGTRTLRERPFTEFHESQHQSPPTTTRKPKRKPVAPHTESSSDEGHLRPSPRRMPPSIKAHEPTITEAGAQFLRVCQNSIHRTMRNIFNAFMSYISGTEDKKDMQMALVIFLVLIAGLIMFGLSDSRTIHHHHWEFFNPPDSKQ